MYLHILTEHQRKECKPSLRDLPCDSPARVEPGHAVICVAAILTCEMLLAIAKC
jgi:hypothetical protein